MLAPHIGATQSMKRILPVSILFAAVPALAAAQSTSSPNQPAPASEATVTLDTMIVSAGPDAKSLFDLAQGTNVVTGDSLRRQLQQTLGETLATTAGVSSTYYGPGASRPEIRGLGGDRVRVLSDGVGSLDASDVSPDHNVSIEPLFASRIEVLRGPSTLLYGSSAVGGAVNVVENRIPSEPGTGSPHGTIGFRGLGADGERTGGAALNMGDSHVTFQVDAMRTKTSDTHIPGVARVDDEAPPDQVIGRIPNTAIDTKDFSVGGTVFWETGRLGASVKRYASLYGVPNGEELPVSIDMKQTKVDLDGSITKPFSIFRSARLRVGVGRYNHSELDGTEIGTKFKNNAWESRLELPHVAIGPVTGMIGAQASYSDFAALGEEVVTPPSRTSNQALFLLEEYKHGSTSIQIGLRQERESIHLGEVDPDLPALPGYGAVSNEKRSYDGTSASVGVVIYPAKDYSIGISTAFTERLPVAQELFSNGPHGGTDAYEIGTADLGKEKSVGLDVSLRKRAGFVTGSISAFANRFSGYIFEQELTADAIPEDFNPEGLTPYQFVARDALFYGGEVEATLHLVDREDQQMHLKLTTDYVHATNTTDDVPLPRIPPWRIGAQLLWNSARWQFGASVRHAFSQDRYTSTESFTPGYTLVGADIAYTVTVGARSFEVFLQGQNLTNEVARVHTSFLKNFAPLPGRGVTIGARVTF